MTRPEWSLLNSTTSNTCDPGGSLLYVTKPVAVGENFPIECSFLNRAMLALE
jgi:hypothetical protein